jgi:signal transduction histidine kinase
MKAHPMVGDSLLAGLLAFLDLMFVAVREIQPPAAGVPEPPPLLLSIPLILIAVLPLVFRRRHPVLVAYAVAATGLPHSVFELGIASLASLCISVYTLVVYASRKHALIFLLMNMAVAAVQLPLQSSSRGELTAMVATGAVAFAFCWVLGEFVGARRAYQAEVEARLHLLETERDQQAKIAVAAERARIARELHDVVAHAVSVIVVQADGAAYAVHTEPEQADLAIKTISATGREALAELRRLLGVLRSEQADEERTPQPGAQSLAELAERVRAVGLPVQLEIIGAIDDLPAGIGLGIYRIVQEALTNVARHSNATRTEVRLRNRVDEMLLEIRDDGRGVTTEELSDPLSFGLIGIRERAAVIGATVQIEGVAGRGTIVSVRIPLAAAKARLA